MQKKLPLTIVLDNIRSAFNVGSVLRTAECAGIEEVITCGFTPEADYFRVKKTSLGAENMIKSRHFKTLEECLEELQRKEFQLFAFESGENGQNFWETAIEQKLTAIIFGHEVDGVQLDITNKFQIPILEIPLFGQKESLNVANATAVAIYDIVKRWKTS